MIYLFLFLPSSFLDFNFTTYILSFFREKRLNFCMVYVNIIVDRRKAWVMPESKYSIGGIKNGISILFFYYERRCYECQILNCR